MAGLKNNSRVLNNTTESEKIKIAAKVMADLLTNTFNGDYLNSL